MKKTRNLKNIILPNKRINLFVFSILIFGVISGSIFLILMNSNDKNSVITQITNFFVNVSKNNVNNGLALRNSLIINYIFVFLIWFLGLSMIGIVVNIFLVYLKGFLVGFSISSIFLTYNIKGLIAACLYTLISQILNIIIITILTIYSLIFAGNLLKIILSKKNTHNRLMVKRYVVILMFSIISSFISSILEVYLFPNVLKLIITIYV